MDKIPEAGKKAEEEAAADLDRTETREALEGEIPGTLILQPLAHPFWLHGKHSKAVLGPFVLLLCTGCRRPLETCCSPCLP